MSKVSKDENHANKNKESVSSVKVFKVQIPESPGRKPPSLGAVI